MHSHLSPRKVSKGKKLYLELSRNGNRLETETETDGLPTHLNLTPHVAMHFFLSVERKLETLMYHVLEVQIIVLIKREIILLKK